MPKAPKLPSTVSRIEVQKKSSVRYSIFSETEFIVGVSDATLVRLDLRKGTVIDEVLYQRIENEEERWKVREYLIGLLSRRDHASFELKQKGLKKDYSAQILDELIYELEQKGYINNHSFAVKYVHDKYEFNKWGPTKIRIELQKKKLSANIIEQALDEVFSEVDQIETIHALILKKKPALLRTEAFKRKKKIFDFLVRKGFSPNTILKQMDYLLELIEK
ncbi:regulatory protein RecX [Balneola vulgaris]|uniref:regulatory protein RecX n=1 Tax=Balneola vulgaris TaxID=287535 RepID=UPI00035D9B76|nr:regulatory protein RecX [Balneola vulgaris]